MDGDIMTMTAGFYKYESEQLLHGPNSVRCLEYQLFKEAKNDYVYPVDGWYWFDTEEEARLVFDLPEPAIEALELTQ